MTPQKCWAAFVLIPVPPLMNGAVAETAGNVSTAPVPLSAVPSPVNPAQAPLLIAAVPTERRSTRSRQCRVCRAEWRRKAPHRIGPAGIDPVRDGDTSGDSHLPRDWRVGRAGGCDRAWPRRLLGAGAWDVHQRCCRRGCAVAEEAGVNGRHGAGAAPCEARLAGAAAARRRADESNLRPWQPEPAEAEIPVKPVRFTALMPFHQF